MNNRPVEKPLQPMRDFSTSRYSACLVKPARRRVRFSAPTSSHLVFRARVPRDEPYFPSAAQRPARRPNDIAIEWLAPATVTG